MYNILEIEKKIDAVNVAIAQPEAVIEHIFYDSRKISQGEGGLFFALDGIRNGHNFLNHAYKQGVRNFVVSRTLDISAFEHANFIWVSDVLESLQKLAAAHRLEYDGTMVGITGSNGKTIVKEWLYQLLGDDISVYQSPQSYNSQLGVALSLSNLNNQYDLALIEAGISTIGEMVRLERMIQPSIGVLTSMGVAHAEGFENTETKVREKLSLFEHAKVVVYPSEEIDYAHYDPSKKTFSWGWKNEDDLRIINIQSVGQKKTLLTIVYNGREHVLSVPFNDRASISNILSCMSVLLLLGKRIEEIEERILMLKPIAMRLQLKNGKNNCSIIDDSYSNDLGSLKIAIDFLNQQKQHAKKSLILSDIVGIQHSEQLQRALQDLLAEQSFSRLIAVGEYLPALLGDLPYPVHYFKETKGLISAIKDLCFENESILIKGSRYYQLENVSRILVEKSHSTILEINLKALESNLKVYKKLLPPDVKIMAMVKALSYGSGSFEIANLLQFNKIDYLTVAYVDEGVKLRQAGIQLPIMVLNSERNDFELLLEYQLEPEIYSFSILNELIVFLNELGIEDRFPIHIKVDTGMHRLGFSPDEVQAVGDLLFSNSRSLLVKSVFSHLAAAGNNEHREFTQKQLNLFRSFTTDLQRKIGDPFLRHIANTAAITALPEDHFDMVRLGIGLYGITIDPAISLENVSVLKTTVTQIKKLKKGESVGYNRQGVVRRDSLIATVRIGYADGYNRCFGNGVGEMMIGGKMVRTIGHICMDMCMLDVTDMEVHEGDEVVVFPSWTMAAKKIQTIAYELLVNISSRVKRVYFYD